MVEHLRCAIGPNSARCINRSICDKEEEEDCSTPLQCIYAACGVFIWRSDSASPLVFFKVFFTLRPELRDTGVYRMSTWSHSVQNAAAFLDLISKFNERSEIYIVNHSLNCN